MHSSESSATGVRIASWNVNGLRSTPSQYLEKVLRRTDVLLLQETKLPSDNPVYDFFKWNDSTVGCAASQSGRAGVIITSRNKPRSVLLNPIPIGGPGRSILTSFDAFSVLNLYFPHGHRDHRNLSEKINFAEATIEFVQRWAGPPLVLGGDFNIAHHDIDVCRYKSNRKSILFLPELREYFDILLEMGYVDSVRSLNENRSGVYSWWPYAFGARDRNVGWRIDYILVPDGISVEQAGHLTRIYGSDHCPVYANIIP